MNPNQEEQGGEDGIQVRSDKDTVPLPAEEDARQAARNTQRPAEQSMMAILNVAMYFIYREIASLHTKIILDSR